MVPLNLRVRFPDCRREKEYEFEVRVWFKVKFCPVIIVSAGCSKDCHTEELGLFSTKLPVSSKDADVTPRDDVSLCQRMLPDEF